MRTRSIVVASLLALCSIGAQAETYNFSFGTWLGSTPSYQPGATFATMSVSTTDHLTYTFDLKALNLDAAFGTTAGKTFISESIFNDWTGNDPTSTAITSGSWGVSSVGFVATAPHVGSVAFDFGDKFGTSAANRLTSNEEVKWTATFGTAQHDPFFGVPPVALHVQGFAQGQVTSGWYVPAAPVPEPETYAMLLTGLGLMGFVARRRKIR
jgi:hypothetical protein